MKCLNKNCKNKNCTLNTKYNGNKSVLSTNNPPKTNSVHKNCHFVENKHLHFLTKKVKNTEKVFNSSQIKSDNQFNANQKVIINKKIKTENCFFSKNSDHFINYNNEILRENKLKLINKKKGFTHKENNNTKKENLDKYSQTSASVNNRFSMNLDTNVKTNEDNLKNNLNISFNETKPYYLNLNDNNLISLNKDNNLILSNRNNNIIPFNKNEIFIENAKEKTNIPNFPKSPEINNPINGSFLKNTHDINSKELHLINSNLISIKSKNNSIIEANNCFNENILKNNLKKIPEPDINKNIKSLKDKNVFGSLINNKQDYKTRNIINDSPMLELHGKIEHKSEYSDQKKTICSNLPKKKFLIEKFDSVDKIKNFSIESENKDFSHDNTAERNKFEFNSEFKIINEKINEDTKKSDLFKNLKFSEIENHQISDKPTKKIIKKSKIKKNEYDINCDEINNTINSLKKDSKNRTFKSKMNHKLISNKQQSFKNTEINKEFNDYCNFLSFENIKPELPKYSYAYNLNKKTKDKSKNNFTSRQFDKNITFQADKNVNFYLKENIDCDDLLTKKKNTILIMIDFTLPLIIILIIMKISNLLIIKN
ncbi:hypothetical protein GVAV_002987 [Gurleya vavrai]